MAEVQAQVQSRPMTGKHKKILEDNRSLIAEHLKVRTIVNRMTNFIDPSDRQSIMCEKTDTDRAYKFLDLLPKCGERAYPCFVNNLMEITGQDWLGNYLATLGEVEIECTTQDQALHTGIQETDYSNISEGNLKTMVHYLVAAVVSNNSNTSEEKVQGLLNVLQRENLKSVKSDSGEGEENIPDNDNATAQPNDLWNSLGISQRNCLMWPDFQAWVEEIKIKIEKGSGNLGITTTVFKPDTITNYTVVKKVVENKPAYGKIEQGDWIVAVDNKSTESCETGKSGKFHQLLKNAGDKVTLTIRKPVDHFKSIKRWHKHPMEIKISLKKFISFGFSHYYMQENENGDIEDRILVFKEPEDSKKHKLERGDYLLSVNKTNVHGLKLKEVYNLVKETKNKKAVLEIRKMYKGKEWQDALLEFALKSPHRVYWNERAKEKTVGKENGDREQSAPILDLAPPKGNFDGQYYHIVKEVIMDSAAYKAGILPGGRLLSVNGKNITTLKKVEVDKLLKQGNIWKLEFTAPKGVRKLPGTEDGGAAGANSGEISDVDSIQDPYCGGSSTSEDWQTTDTNSEFGTEYPGDSESTTTAEPRSDDSYGSSPDDDIDPSSDVHSSPPSTLLLNRNGKNSMKRPPKLAGRKSSSSEGEYSNTGFHDSGGD